MDATAVPRTSTAVATIAADGGASYEFDLDWRIDPVDVPEGTPLVHVGSIGAVLQPGAATVLDAVRARPAGTLLSVDPNVRPSITPDRGAVLATLEPLLAEADVVKCSDEDAAWLWPDRDVDAVLDGLLAAGATLAAVTLGGSGCAIASHGARRRIAAPAVTVADTIGAGDSFMAGLLAAVLATGTAPTDLDEDDLGPPGRARPRVRRRHGLPPRRGPAHHGRAARGRSGPTRRPDRPDPDETRPPDRPGT